MSKIGDPPKYPFHAFNMLIRNTADEIHRNIQAPDALIGMALIAGMAIVSQGLIEVKLPTGQKRPTSLNLIGIAESGERKSTIDALVFAPLYEHDRLKAMAFKAELNTYQLMRELWEAKNHGLRNRFVKAVRKEEAVDAIEMEMAEHAKLKPTKPRLRRFMRQNITSRALMDALQGDGESIAVATDEGQVMFKSDAMAQLGFLNKAWDGAPMLTLDRADMDHVLVMSPRVTISIMTQKSVLQAYLQKHGDIAKGSGHWARYLVGWPASTQGHREVNSGELVWDFLPTFQARMTELQCKYDEVIESGEITRELVEFSEDAKERWFELAQQTEWMLRPGDYLHDINDFASKVMEILGRLAAVMHYFNGEDGRISLDTLERAVTIMSWHVDEYKRLFSPQFTLPKEQVDAQKLAEYLRDNIWEGPQRNTFVPKSYFLHHGPAQNRARLNAAVSILEGLKAIWVVTETGSRRLLLQLSNNYFASM